MPRAATLDGAMISKAVQHQGHHVATKHPAPVGGESQRASAKVEAWKWPKVSLDTSEGHWHYFLSRWESYKVATKVS